jgi:hypothetical protein
MAADGEKKRGYRGPDANPAPIKPDAPERALTEKAASESMSFDNLHLREFSAFHRLGGARKVSKSETFAAGPVSSQ